MKKSIPAIFVYSFISFHLQAQQQPKVEPGAGSVAYSSGDYKVAIQQWQPLADEGNSQAAYNMAYMYDHGYGVQKDPAEVSKWLQKSADLGDVRAWHSLGDMYHGKKDYDVARQWYKKAADAGLADAQFDLGVMYDLGEGVPQNFAEALSWYQKAAAQGYGPAFCNIAVLYYNGQGVKIDRVTAHRNFLIANQLGDARAKDLMKFSENKLNKKQLEQAQQQADTWLQEHANNIRAGA